MKKFEEQYRIRESDDVLDKENAVHADLDRRMDAVEVDAQAFRDGNRADVDAILQSLTRTFSGLAAETRALLDATAGGLTAASIGETATRTFLTPDRRAAILADALTAAGGAVTDAVIALKGNAVAGRDNLKALSDLIDANAAAVSAAKGRLDAIMTGADASLDTFVEVLQKFASVDAAISTANDAVSKRLRTDVADQSLNPASKHNARFAISAAPVEAMAWRNIFYNGRCEVSQEKGNAATVASGGAAPYILDGFALSSQGPALSGQRVTSPFPNRPELVYGLKVSVSTAKAVLAAGDGAHVEVRLEGTRFKRMLFGAPSAKNLFLGVYVLPNFTGTLYAHIRNAAFNRSCVRKYTVSANVEQFVQLIFPGDTAGTWLGDSTNVAAYIGFSLGSGASAQAAPANDGVWTATGAACGSDQTNVGGNAANTIVFSDFIALDTTLAANSDPAQVIAQDRLAGFERPYEETLRICQRYWQTMPATNYRTTASGNFGGGYKDLTLPVPMRVSPTVTRTFLGGNYDAPTFTSSTNTVAMSWSAGSTVGDYGFYTLYMDARL